MSQELKDKTFQIYCHMIVAPAYRSFDDDPEYLVSQAKLMALAFMNEWNKAAVK